MLGEVRPRTQMGAEPALQEEPAPVRDAVPVVTLA
jgi:hypothetical protein